MVSSSSTSIEIVSEVTIEFLTDYGIRVVIRFIRVIRDIML